MNCIICTSGASNGFFSMLAHMTMNLPMFGAILATLIALALFACYRVGIAYTRQAQTEIDDTVSRGLVDRSKLR